MKESDVFTTSDSFFVTGSVKPRCMFVTRQLIESAKAQVAVTVNSAMTMMYWHIGDRINRELLGGERAAYGRQVIASFIKPVDRIVG